MRMGLPRFTSKPEDNPDHTMIPQFSFEGFAGE
jgi:hypothetical protein